tara:strand:- start:1370 stop:1639 length:270 start_codon:yes stop_codon:yes gene_type:complete
MKVKFGNTLALKEFLLDGNSITNLESLLFFGVQNLSAELTRLKKNGYIIKKQKLTLTKLIKRVNKITICKLPKELLSNEIIVNEWYISK